MSRTWRVLRRSWEESELVRVAGGALVLGLVGGGAFVSLLYTGAANSPATTLTMYALVLVIYHTLEFTLTAAHRIDKLTFDSFLLNQSREFHIAMVAAICEFVVEAWMFPSIKVGIIAQYVRVVGACLCAMGQYFRAKAMIDAGSNFTHVIATNRESTHKLVTTGVYSYLRHPSYFGWFYWSIGTQFLLCNPLCSIGYAIAAWHFFQQRIPYEELLLYKFFGDEYDAFVSQTRIGIPFIKGAREVSR